MSTFEASPDGDWENSPEELELQRHPDNVDISMPDRRTLLKRLERFHSLKGTSFSDFPSYFANALGGQRLRALTIARIALWGLPQITGLKSGDAKLARRCLPNLMPHIFRAALDDYEMADKVSYWFSRLPNDGT